jgi:hypothetical protein
MSRVRRRYEAGAVALVLAVFGALYAWAVVPRDPTPVDLAAIAVLVGLPAFLWLVASLLVIDQWWAGAGAGLSTMDAPGRLLAAAVTLLPESRRRWGEAMLAELAHVHGRSARRRFALSCGRAALTLPSPRRARPPVPVATVLVIAAVAACVAATAAFLAQHPAAADSLPPGGTAVLAVVLAVCLGLAVAPSGTRSAATLGIGGAVVFILALMASSHIDVEGLPALCLLFGPVPAFGVPAFVAAAIGRSLRAGVRAGIWTAITVMPLSMAVGLFGASRQFAATGTWTFAGDSVTAGFSFGFVFLTVLAVPALGFPFAVFGAAAGAGVRPRQAA